MTAPIVDTRQEHTPQRGSARAGGFRHYWQLVRLKVFANLRAEASTNYLNYAWWLLDPILHMSVFYLVFGVLLQRGTEDFVVFLLCGLIPWIWFHRTVSNAMVSILFSKGLIMQVYIPKLLLPVFNILQDGIKQTVVLSVLLLFLLVYGITPASTWWLLVPLVMLQFVFNAAFGLLASALVPFIPDLRFFITAGLQLLMFGSGIFYSPAQIPADYRDEFFLNPVAVLLDAYRDILLYQSVPDLERLGLVLFGAAAVLSIAAIVLVRLDYKYPRVILE